jgi:hypothetical protein
MALPTRRFRVAGTLFGLGVKAERGREEAGHGQRRNNQPQHDQPEHDHRQHKRWADDGSEPDGSGSSRGFMSRADVESAHPPRVYRLEGAIWREVKIRGKGV